MAESSDSVERKKKDSYRITIIGSLANFGLMAFKFVAGFVGHSGAMIADAVHSASDLISDVVVLVFVKISSKPSDASHDYGHGKFETLATAIISLMLLFVGLGIFWNGGKEIYRYLCGEELEQPGMIALIAALISIVVKEILFHATKRVAKKWNSAVLEANAWHHRTDSYSSIATAIGIAGAMFFGIKWRVLDPIAAVLVSLLIIKVGYELVIPCLDELLERSLSPEIEKKILKAAGSIPEIHNPHALKTRKVGELLAIDIHVKMDGNMTVEESHNLTKKMERKIREDLGDKVIIYTHVEPYHPKKNSDKEKGIDEKGEKERGEEAGKGSSRCKTQLLREELTPVTSSDSITKSKK